MITVEVDQILQLGFLVFFSVPAKRFIVYEQQLSPACL